MASQKRYKLRYLPLFWDDLNEASGYIRDVLHNPQASSRLLDKTEEAILLCSTMPEAARSIMRRRIGQTPIGG